MTIAKQSRNWLPEAILVIALCLLPCLFFWRLLAPNPADRATIPAGDFTEQYYPLHLFAAREWAQGRLPLWDPHIYGGQPALADIQSGALYPLNLLVILLLALAGLGFPLWALEAQVILHFSLASVFTYLFVRRLSRSRFASLVSALTFTYSGYLTSFPVQQVTILQVAVWLPLILLLLDLATGDGDPVCRRFPAVGSRFWFYVTLAGLAFGCSILAGHPQTAMHVLYASVVYFAFKVWKRVWQGPFPGAYRTNESLTEGDEPNHVILGERSERRISFRKPGTGCFAFAQHDRQNLDSSAGAEFMKRHGIISRGLVGILVFVLMAFGLAAVQLLPTLEEIEIVLY